MIGLEAEALLVLLIAAEAKEPFHVGLGVRAVDPVARRLPPKLGALGRGRQRFARGEQRLDVDAVVDRAVLTLCALLDRSLGCLRFLGLSLVTHTLMSPSA